MDATGPLKECKCDEVCPKCGNKKIIPLPLGTPYPYSPVYPYPYYPLYPQYLQWGI